MLKGKTAVITGGSRGIGRAIALELAKNGANVAIVYAGRHDAALEVAEAAQALQVKAASYQCDVSDFDKAGQLIKDITGKFGTIDILINNAGITADGLVARMSESDFDRVLDVNLKGAFNMIRHSAGLFMKKRSGRIINITSVVALMGNPGQANYCAAKAGLIGLTKSVARELAPRGITCNAIAPGFIETDMTKDMPQSAKENFTNTIPLKRIGAASDIAFLTAFLSSEAASYITGAVIPVDGGLSM